MNRCFIESAALILSSTLIPLMVQSFRTARCFRTCAWTYWPVTVVSAHQPCTDTASFARRCKPRSTIHDPRSTIHHPPSTIHNPQSTIHHPPSTIQNPQSTIHNPQSIVADDSDTQTRRKGFEISNHSVGCAWDAQDRAMWGCLRDFKVSVKRVGRV